MVAGDDHHLAAGERLGKRGERRRGDLEHLRQRAVAKLEHVAEQHQAVDAVERLEQGFPEALAAQQVGAAAEPEMQVGDHRRAHRAIVAAAGGRALR